MPAAIHCSRSPAIAWAGKAIIGMPICRYLGICRLAQALSGFYLPAVSAQTRLATFVPLNPRMLKITLHDEARELRFGLEGRLSGPWVSELRECWKTSAPTAGTRPTVVDLREVDFVDSDGQGLLTEMHRKGARLVAEMPFIRAMIQEIARACRCATVEGKPARRPHAVLNPDTAGRDPRPL